MPVLQSERIFVSSKLGLTAADAVWIATATLHRRNPGVEGFPVEDIVAEAVRQKLTHALAKTVYQHALQHCVANRPPNPNRSRMLFEFGDGYRRLFRAGDRYNSAREGSPIHPEWSSLPPAYKDLQRWYEEKWNSQAEDPLLALIGSGKHLWKDESGDEFLARLRSNWGGVA
jgi:hypothetical protein